MNIEEIRKIVSTIRASLFKNSGAYAVGMLKSQFKGSGLRFKEHQVYVHGDDVRFIDWKVLAKTSVPYVKIFEEDRNTEIVVVIDASATMLAGFNNISKLQVSLEICCLLYLLSHETGDKVHTIVMADEIIDVPPSSGEKGITRLVGLLHSKGIITKNGRVNVMYEYSEEVFEKTKLNAIMKHLKKRREAVILSDFHELFRFDFLSKLICRPNVHAFRLESPLDRADKIPWSLYSKRKPYMKESVYHGIDSISRDNKSLLENKRLKVLKIEERYLEGFVKNIL